MPVKLQLTPTTVPRTTLRLATLAARVVRRGLITMTWLLISTEWEDLKNLGLFGPLGVESVMKIMLAMI